MATYNHLSTKTEIIAGFTTFFTMAYIIFIQPDMLALTGMDKKALIAVTCLVSGIITIFVGIIGKVPIAMAPGLGLNSFFTYTLVLGQKIPWQTALGIVFLSGFFFFILTIVGLRKKLLEALPKSMIYAITVGIGIFISFIGLKNLGLVVSNEATIVSLGKFNPTVLIGIGGLILAVSLEAFRIKGALLISIVTSTIIALIFGYTPLPEKIISTNIDLLPIAFKLDIISALKWSLIGPIFSLMFIAMFDGIGTLVGCYNKMGKMDDKSGTSGINRILALDAFGSMFGALMGTSTTTAYIESATGIEAGGRTGKTAIVTGLLFLSGLLFIPVIGIVPPYATAPALIIVGLFMTREIVNIDFTNLEEGFPAFITILMIAFSFSISTGLALGFISYTLLKLIKLRFSELNITLLIITVLCILFLIV
ncbi:MAG: NCS2 family permease [Bacteroidales bacterium]|nr:NCS2 family permease [Bacteroidales bacterium]